MEQVKPFYKSRGVIGAVMVLAGVAAQALGYTFGPEEQQAAVNLVSAALEAVGGLVALWGRLAATKQIKPIKPVAPPAAGLLVLLCLGLALSAAGCGLGEVMQAAPGQEEVTASVEAKALLAQQTTAQSIAEKLDKLVNTAYFEPIDPAQPMVVTNARMVVKTVDSRIYDMVATMVDYKGYKSPPGFWSAVIRLFDVGERAAPWLFPWLMVRDVADMGRSNSTTYSGSFNGNQGGVAAGNGNGWSMPTKITTTSNSTTGAQSPIGNNNWAGPRDNISNPTPPASSGE